MPTGYQIENQEGLYFLTFQIVGWIDLFTRQTYRDMVNEILKFCRDQKGLNLLVILL